MRSTPGRRVSRRRRYGPVAVVLVVIATVAGCASVAETPAAVDGPANETDTCGVAAAPVEPPEPDSATGTIRVMAASSLTGAFDELVTAFQSPQPRAHVQVTAGASSELVARLAAGASADVIATADTATMARAVDAGDVEKPEIFTCNRMALLVGAGNPLHIDGLHDLNRDDVHFVLCAQQVPCGRLGRKVLGDAGIDAQPVGSEPNVTAVVTKVAGGEVDAGITYVTDARTNPDATDEVPIPDAVDVATSYPIAVTADADAPDTARAFIAFVRSPAGRKILHAHDFTSG